MYSINWDNGIINEGNQAKIKNVMNKAKAGDTLTIGFIGGSITQGSLATKPENCYAARVFKWWENKFPESSFTYVNAGIGGTTSHFGVARAEDDLLSKKPDFVIAEFSVNDDDNEFFLETYEGLVRRILTADCEPALMLVHNVRYDTGLNAEPVHSKIGRYYNLPSVSMQKSIYPEVESKNLPVRDITEDDLHPNDLGHELVAGVITNMLEHIYNSENVCKCEDVEAFKEPMTSNNYEKAIRYRNDNSNPKCEGFYKDEQVQERITDTFRKGWISKTKGDSIIFEMTGTEIAVQYRKTVNKPAPVAVAIVDGDEENRHILDGNFDEDWGDCTYLQPVLVHGENKKHTVEIRTVETHEDDKSSFYLISVIGN